MPQHKSQQETQHLYTVNEAAEYLRVSRHEIYAYMKSKQLPYYVLPGGLKRAQKQPRRRIRKENLDNLLLGPILGDYIHTQLS